MSRYGVDRAMRGVVMSDAQRDRFLAEPQAFLADYALTEAERVWLAERDYGALYRMGAHPFLLFPWAQRVDRGERSTLMRRYTEAVEPHGHPDYST
jgi:hypothetical protein